MAANTAHRSIVDDDLDNFDVDDFADPFADSGDENAKAKTDAQSKKRKDASGLGIEEVVNVAKKQRVPNVKLDTPRLLSDKGIPKLRRKARELKFKGKGHEFSDTARLLSFYQLWLDDLYPKAKFLNALAMIEKAGHTKHMQMERLAWINEGKPKPPRDDDDEDEVPQIITDILGHDATVLPARVAPIFQKKQSSERPKTPAAVDDLFGDAMEEDIYDATPKGSKTTAPRAHTAEGEPDEEDLDALMAEEEAQRAAPSTSLFGSGSLFGNGKPAAKPPTTRPAEPDEDDLDALMAEAELESSKPSRPPAAQSQSVSKPNKPAPAVYDEEDDLDALIAEAEAAESRPPSKPQPPTTTTQVEKGADADEEEAMVEMEGLW